MEKGEQKAGEQPEKVASPSAEERGRASQKGKQPICEVLQGSLVRGRVAVGFGTRRSRSDKESCSPGGADFRWCGW